MSTVLHPCQCACVCRVCVVPVVSDILSLGSPSHSNHGIVCQALASTITRIDVIQTQTRNEKKKHTHIHSRLSFRT